MLRFLCALAIATMVRAEVRAEAPLDAAHTPAEATAARPDPATAAFAGFGCASCPADALLEGEPICADGTVDLYNPGCDVRPPIFGGPVLAPGVAVCGTSGTFLGPDGDDAAQVRDVDWYEIVVEEPGQLRVDVAADFDVTASLLGPDCLGPELLATGDATACDVLTLTVDLPDGGLVLLAVAPTSDAGVPCGAPYVVDVAIGPPVVGACCLFDGTCIDGLAEDECIEGQQPAGGFWQGADSLCADVTCCTLVCPPEGIDEGEFLFDGYDDEFNSGCNATISPPAIAAVVTPGEIWCGTSGHHLNGGGQPVRDTDWYLLDLPTTMEVTWQVVATFESQIAILRPGPPGLECAQLELLANLSGTPACQPGAITLDLLPGQYYLFVSTSTFPLGPVTGGTSNVPANAPYIGTVEADFVAVGPCCFTDGACVELPNVECGAAGGLPAASGTDCGTADCCVPSEGGGGAPEGEPGGGGCIDGYVDTFNGGCNSPVAVFQPIEANELVIGTSGTFESDSGEAMRDTDWYCYTHGGGELKLRYIAQFETTFALLAPGTMGDQGCDDASMEAIEAIERCVELKLKFDLPAGKYWLFVAPSAFVDVPCGSEYGLLVGCDESCADVDGDGTVNLADLNEVLSAFNTAQPVGRGGDVDCDAFVDLADLNLVLSAFDSDC